MGIVGCGSSSVDVDVDILELSRLDFSKDDIRILLSSFEEMLHHSPSKDIANLQGASVYFGIEISPFIRRLFDIESDRAPMPPKRFIHSIWYAPSHVSTRHCMTVFPLIFMCVGRYALYAQKTWYSTLITTHLVIFRIRVNVRF